MATRSLEDLNQAQLERLAFVEFRLWFLGDVRRPDLIDRFGIAPAVATRDLASYREVAPDNIVFNDSRKVYEPTSSFKPIFDHEPDRVLNALSRGFGEGIGRASAGFLACAFHLRLNQPSLPALAVITRAIHQKRAVRLTYHSFTSGTTKREIVPFSLVDSGSRWHVRAYDRMTKQFRDFVLTRMEKPRLLEAESIPSQEQPSQDHEWNRMVTLELVPHPAVSRPEVVERDYGMKDSRIIVTIRAANAGYGLQQWNVDCSKTHSLDPSRYRLWLKDPLVLYGVQSAVLASGYNN